MFGPWENVRLDPITSAPTSPAADSVYTVSSLGSSLEDLALDMARKDAASGSSTENCLRLHDQYYFRETNVQLVVEDVVYNLPRTLLSRLSARLEERFNQTADALPPGWITHKTALGEYIYINHGSGAVQQTRPSVVGPFADARPLFGVTVQEFDALLSVVIRGRDDYNEYKLDAGRWISVVKLATLFDIPSIRALALAHLDQPIFALTPFERLLIARTHDVPEWLDGALEGLIRRTDPLGIDEVAQMTAMDIVLVSSAREQAANALVCPPHNYNPSLPGELPAMSRFEEDDTCTPPSARPRSLATGRLTTEPDSENEGSIDQLGQRKQRKWEREQRDVTPEAMEQSSKAGTPLRVPSPSPEDPAGLSDVANLPARAPPDEDSADHGGIPGGYGGDDDPPPPPPAPEPLPEVAAEPEVQEPPLAWGSAAASRAGSKPGTRVPSAAPSKAPANRWGSAAPSVCATSPAPPPTPGKSPSPQPNADAGPALPPFLNTSPGEESGAFGLGDPLGGAPKKASGWGWGGFGGGASGQTSPNLPAEVPKKTNTVWGVAAAAPAATSRSGWGSAARTGKRASNKKIASWGTAAAAPATRNRVWGGGGGDGGDDQEAEKADEGRGFGSANKGKGKGSAWGAVTDEKSETLGGGR